MADIAETPNSFAAGTLVLLDDGSSKPIEKLQPGDTVKATNAETSVTEPQQVTATVAGKGHKDLVELTLVGAGSGGGGPPAKITTTAGHKFYTPAKGWTAATDLKIGDKLRDTRGRAVTVTKTAKHGATTTVYNLTVNNTHTYYVLAGNTTVLVHNCGDLEPCAGSCKIVGDGTPRLYERPTGTTPAQRASVQGQSCVTCGGTSTPMVADHKVPLVVEWYQNFKINLTRARSLGAVQPQCRPCSDAQGGRMRTFGQKAARAFGLID
jgi:hypothetical protein